MSKDITEHRVQHSLFNQMTSAQAVQRTLKHAQNIVGLLYCEREDGERHEQEEDEKEEKGKRRAS